MTTVLVATRKRYLMIQNRKWAGKSLKLHFSFSLHYIAGLALGNRGKTKILFCCCFLV